MKVLRASDYKRMPWKNGGGETVEIAVFPPDASVSDFDWRVSMATVAYDGPFSVFPGIDRTISILQGAEMELTIEGHGRVLIGQSSAPYGFPADAPTAARLVDGTITDLNIMSRRGRVAHSVETFVAPVSLEQRSALTLVLCHRGKLTASNGANIETLQELDAVLVDPGTQCDISGDASGFVIRLSGTDD